MSFGDNGPRAKARRRARVGTTRGPRKRPLPADSFSRNFTQASVPLNPLARSLIKAQIARTGCMSRAPNDGESFRCTDHRALALRLMELEARRDSGLSLPVDFAHAPHRNRLHVSPVCLYRSARKNRSTSRASGRTSCHWRPK